MVHAHAANCVFVIYMPPQPVFFASSTLKIGGGVFNCLSEANKTQFLTTKLYRHNEGDTVHLPFNGGTLRAAIFVTPKRMCTMFMTPARARRK